MPFRYYEYVSETKVEMLYPQIDQTSASAGGEVGFDLKIIKASRKTGGRRDPSTYDKLDVIEDWIYAHEPVGNVDEPKAWIYGRMSLAVAIIDTSWETPDPDEIKSAAVVYAGRSEDGSWLLLGGSARHLTAERDHNVPRTELSYLTSKITSAADSLHFLLHRCREVFSDGPSSDLHEQALSDIEERHPWELITMPVHIILDNFAGHRRLAAELGVPSRRRIISRIGHYEFLAKRLLTAEPEGHPSQRLATLATPLFVALVD